MFLLFFFNKPRTTDISTLSQRDALPISADAQLDVGCHGRLDRRFLDGIHDQHRPTDPRVTKSDGLLDREDRKSTRLNSSHANISYAVFCLKKKKKTLNHPSSHKTHCVLF